MWQVASGKRRRAQSTGRADGTSVRFHFFSPALLPSASSYTRISSYFNVVWTRTGQHPVSSHCALCIPNDIFSHSGNIDTSRSRERENRTPYICLALANAFSFAFKVLALATHVLQHGPYYFVWKLFLVLFGNNNIIS